jgi:hypothetical protein
MHSISILSPANISKIVFLVITAFTFFRDYPVLKNVINESLTLGPEAHFRTEQVRSGQVTTSALCDNTTITKIWIQFCRNLAVNCLILQLFGINFCDKNVLKLKKEGNMRWVKMYKWRR